MKFFRSKISGIPCWVQVENYSPSQPANEDEPAYGPEIDFILLDNRMRRAKWLEPKITQADRYRLADEYESIMTEEWAAAKAEEWEQHHAG